MDANNFFICEHIYQSSNVTSRLLAVKASIRQISERVAYWKIRRPISLKFIL